MMKNFLTKNNDDIEIIFSDVFNSLKQIVEPKLIESDFQSKNQIIKEWSGRKDNFEKQTGFKETSKPEDFAKFSELVKFVLENKSIFDEIFSKNPRTYDFLASLSHLYQKDILSLLDTDKNEIIAKSWHILKEIEEWQSKDKPKILWYSADFSFDSFTDDKDSISKAKRWFSRLEAKSQNHSEVLHPNLGRIYRLDYESGPIFVTNPITNKITLEDKIIYSVRVRMMTQNTVSLDYAINLGNYPYGNLSFVIRDNLDFRSLNSTLNLLENDSNFDNDFINWGGIEYSISKKPNVLVTILPENRKEYRMRLMKKNSYFGDGFVAAHKFFTPKIIFEILLGLQEKKNIKELISYSLKKNETIIIE